MPGYDEIAQQPLGDNILAQIAATARDILEAREEVARAEDELKKKQTALRILQEETLPELMTEAGQQDLTTVDGLRITIKEIVRGQPSKENEQEAFKWLRETGNSGIIKTQVVADLGKGEEEKARQVLDALSSLGVPATPKNGVQWQTLGALVRELLARGDAVPLDLLGVRIWKQAEVKPK